MQNRAVLDRYHPNRGISTSRRARISEQSAQTCVEDRARDKVHYLPYRPLVGVGGVRDATRTTAPVSEKRSSGQCLYTLASRVTDVSTENNRD